MSRRPTNSRLSISSGISIPASVENVTSFEEYLSMAHEITAPIEQQPPPPAPTTTKEQIKKSSKYGIHIQRNKDAVKKLANNFVELNKQKIEQPPQRERAPSTWRSLIKGVLDLQRGKIPLLLAVEAGNQSMVRELLSQQAAEQLQVSFAFVF